MRTLILTGALALAALTGCAGMTDREQRITSGAVIGGVLGNVVSGGSTAGTVGGAVVGGVVGAGVDNDAKAREARRQYDECRRWNSRRYCDYKFRF